MQQLNNALPDGLGNGGSTSANGIWGQTGTSGEFWQDWFGTGTTNDVAVGSSSAFFLVSAFGGGAFDSAHIYLAGTFNLSSLGSPHLHADQRGRRSAAACCGLVAAVGPEWPGRDRSPQEDCASRCLNPHTLSKNQLVQFPEMMKMRKNNLIAVAVAAAIGSTGAYALDEAGANGAQIKLVVSGASAQRDTFRTELQKLCKNAGTGTRRRGQRLRHLPRKRRRFGHLGRLPPVQLHAGLERQQCQRSGRPPEPDGCGVVPLRGRIGVRHRTSAR